MLTSNVILVHITCYLNLLTLHAFFMFYTSVPVKAFYGCNILNIALTHVHFMSKPSTCRRHALLFMTKLACKQAKLITSEFLLYKLDFR